MFISALGYSGGAWTPAGGDILFIEAARFLGDGEPILTGQLGDVMKESAEATLSLVKSRAEDLLIHQEARRSYPCPGRRYSQGRTQRGDYDVHSIDFAADKDVVRNDTAMTLRPCSSDRRGPAKATRISARRHHDRPAS